MAGVCYVCMYICYWLLDSAFWFYSIHSEKCDDISQCFLNISHISWFFSFLFYFILLLFFISWRLITLQYCSGFCHTLTWISHGYTCIPHPNPPSHFQIINQNDIICGVSDCLQSIYHTLAYIRKQSLNFNNLYVITRSYLTLLWNEIP